MDQTPPSDGSVVTIMGGDSIDFSWYRRHPRPRNLADTVFEGVKRIMTALDDLNAQVADLQTNITAVASQVQTELDALQTQIAAGVAAENLAPAIATLTSLNQQLLAIGQQRPTQNPAPPA